MVPGRSAPALVAVLLAALLCLAFGVSQARAQATPQVVGGAPTAITATPFAVAVYGAATDPYDGLVCGGVIVDATHVITAAHCLFDILSVDPPSTLAVLAGSSALPFVTGSAALPSGAVIDPVAQSSFDPTWDPNTGEDDVGLLTLQNPLWNGPTPPALDGASTIAPIPYGTAADESAGQAVTVSGWGYAAQVPPNGVETGNDPQQLQSGALGLITDASCTSDLIGTGIQLSPSQLCATGSTTATGPCYGDSGGPLFAPGGSPPAGDRLVGLVDLGYGCGEGYPNVFTNIADPGVQRFLLSDPPQAPYQLSDITIDSLGPTVTCHPGGWAGNPTLAYQFYADTGSGSPPDALTPLQSSPVYIAPSGGVGLPIYCVVVATNAGGVGAGYSTDNVTPVINQITTTTASSSASTTVNTGLSTTTTANGGAGQPTTQTTTTPTPPGHTSIFALPSLRARSAACARHRCTVVVAGVDAGGPGVLSVNASLHEIVRVPCREKGRRATCTRSVREAASVQPLSGGRFEVKAAGLPRGSYTLTLVAVDRDGRRQAPPTTLALHVG